MERKEVKLSLLADNMTLYTEKASLVAQIVKHLPAMQETWVQSLGCGDPWRRKWQPTPVFLPGKSHGRRSLEGYSSWGHQENIFKIYKHITTKKKIT